MEHTGGPPYQLPDILKTLPGEEKIAEVTHQRRQLIARVGLSALAGGLTFLATGSPAEVLGATSATYVGVDVLTHYADTKDAQRLHLLDPSYQHLFHSIETNINSSISYAYHHGKTDAVIDRAKKVTSKIAGTNQTE